MGVSVGNLFYSQSLLPVIASGLDLLPARVVLIPVMLQAGLLTSLVFVLPAGDRVDRRLMLRWIAFGASCSCLLIAFSTGLPFLLLAFYLLGFCSLTSYILPPFLSGLVKEQDLGRLIGILLSGQFAGILSSRFISGLMADWFGWRSIYLLSSVLMASVAFLWPLLIPRDRECADEPYWSMLADQCSLLLKYSVLRRACSSQGFQFAAFVVVWTGLSMHLGEVPFSFGPAQIGAFGLVGLSSILTSTWVGRMVDRHGAPRVITCCGSISLLGVLGLRFGSASVPAIVVCLAFIDFGVQGSYVANQARVLSLDLAARSRLGALLFISAFGAAALSGLLLERLWPTWGWHGGLTLALVLVVTAMVTQLPGSLLHRLAFVR